MADLFQYLKWRGDIPFSCMGLNDVDGLIFSTLAYVQYEGVVAEDLRTTASLRTVAKTILALSEPEKRTRVSKDLELLAAVADAARYESVGITGYRSIFVPEEETQFAAVTFLLDDGSAFLAYRGTDDSLIGWKEDFNMSFQESVPAQRLAQAYAQDVIASEQRPVYLGGHSKGGNLAVYAGAKCGLQMQQQIRAVYNYDGPGFSEAMTKDPGYLRIVPKVRTLVPQSSVFGMLLEHEESYTVIRSNSVGILQHDPYSWELMGKDFIVMESLTSNSRFLHKTLKTWLAGLDNEQRNEFVDTIFDLLMLENAKHPRDVIRPQNLFALLKTMQMEESKRKILASALLELVDSARQTHSQMNEEAPPVQDTARDNV